MLKTVSMAGIAEQGVPYKKESIQLEEAAQTLSIGNLTWIECVVDDIVSETPKILEKLDIKMDPKVLLSGYVSAYEDAGDTLGIMLPFIVTGLQWLIKNGIITIPPTEQGAGSDYVIPSWLKNNAAWWADGQIDDSFFVSGLQWLISNGIMSIS